MMPLSDKQMQQLDAADKFLNLTDIDKLKELSITFGEDATVAALADEPANLGHSFLKEMFFEMQNLRIELVNTRTTLESLQHEHKSLVEAVIKLRDADRTYRDCNLTDEADNNLRSLASRNGFSFW